MSQSLNKWMEQYPLLSIIVINAVIFGVMGFLAMSELGGLNQ